MRRGHKNEQNTDGVKENKKRPIWGFHKYFINTLSIQDLNRRISSPSCPCVTIFATKAI